MEVQEILLARAIRLVKVSTAIGYWPDLVKDLGKRYSFARTPDIEEILDSQNKGAAKGAEFQLGKLRRPDGTPLVIEKFTVFNDGLVVDSRTSTDDCDTFLDDIEQWAKKNLSGIRNVSKSRYLSQLEVKFDVTEYATAFSGLREQVASLLMDYGIPGINPYGFGSLALAMEPSQMVGLQPSPFMIDRRLNVPFADNVFFAQAPLRTSDHIRLLGVLEQTLAEI